MDDWEKRSGDGAYIHPTLGGILREKRPGASGWYWYPKGKIYQVDAVGPHRTLRTAQAVALIEQQQRLD